MSDVIVTGFKYPKEVEYKVHEGDSPKSVGVVNHDDTMFEIFHKFSDNTRGYYDIQFTREDLLKLRTVIEEMFKNDSLPVKKKSPKR